MIEIMKENAAVIGCVLLMVLFPVRGWKKGFLRMCSMPASVILTIIALRFALPYAEELFGSSSLIKEIGEKVSRVIVEKVPELVHAAGFGVFPALDTMSASLAASAQSMVIRIVSFVVLFIFVRLIVRLLVSFSEAAAGLPVLGTLNRLTGMALGLAESILYIWILMLGVTVFSYTETGKMLLDQITASPFLSVLYANNLLMHLLGTLNVGL